MTVVWHERLASTMDAAHSMAEAGAPHGTGVAAREQASGRGRRGKAWASPRGGLWLSVVCRPTNPTGMEHLSLRVGLAVAQALDTLLGGMAPLTIKRPNDLFIGGKKVAGILCEARWEGAAPLWVVVGLGLNVSNRLPSDVTALATTLAESGVETTPDLLAEPLALVIATATLEAGPLTAEEEARLIAREHGS
ncbi:MAG TPA: biotin--[acetyl-CoA-carboxylase] ligase [Gemmatimonadales bacterium]|nr:biotin--[acetyl-CoA-carboxylase] ligase [Gemmatimonadales bacterium]